MIHLDTNLIISAVDPGDVYHSTVRRLLSGSKSFAASAVAWMEFHSRPISPLVHEAMKGILTGGVIAFDSSIAVLAGEIFHQTGSHRRTRIEAMIAATAISAGAELATFNTDDFRAFLPHGLQLYPLA